MKMNFFRYFWYDGARLSCVLGLLTTESPMPPGARGNPVGGPPLHLTGWMGGLPPPPLGMRGSRHWGFSWSRGVPPLSWSGVGLGRIWFPLCSHGSLRQRACNSTSTCTLSHCPLSDLSLFLTHSVLKDRYLPLIIVSEFHFWI